MKVDVTARNNGISDRAKKYAETKIGRLDRFFDRIKIERINNTFYALSYQRIRFRIDLDICGIRNLLNTNNNIHLKAYL